MAVQRPYFDRTEVNRITHQLAQQFSMKDISPSPNNSVDEFADERKTKDGLEYLIGPLKKSANGLRINDEIWGSYGSHIHMIFAKQPEADRYRIHSITVTLRPKGMHAKFPNRDHGVEFDIASTQYHHHFFHKAELDHVVDNDPKREVIITAMNLAVPQWIRRFGELSKFARNSPPPSDNLKRAWTFLSPEARGPEAVQSRHDVVELLHGLLTGVRDVLNHECQGHWGLEKE